MPWFYWGMGFVQMLRLAFSHEPHWIEARRDTGLWIPGDPPLPVKPATTSEMDAKLDRALDGPPKPRPKPGFAECAFYAFCFVFAVLGVLWMILAQLFEKPWHVIIWTILICAIFSIAKQIKTGKYSNKWF